MEKTILLIEKEIAITIFSEFKVIVPTFADNFFHSVTIKEIHAKKYKDSIRFINNKLNNTFSRYFYV